MKFSTAQFITLIAASTAIAHSLPEKRDDDFKLTGACKEEFDKYHECMFDDDSINLNNLDEKCSLFNSKKCQDFYRAGASGLGPCKGEVNYKLDHNDAKVGYAYYSIMYDCAKDENGNICPLAKFSLEHHSYHNTKQPTIDYNEALEATCKSQRCSEIYITFEKGIDDSTRKITASVNEITDAALDKAYNIASDKVNQYYNKASDEVDKAFNKAGNKVDNAFNQAGISKNNRRDTVVVVDKGIQYDSTRQYLDNHKCISDKANSNNQATLTYLNTDSSNSNSSTSNSSTSNSSTSNVVGDDHLNSNSTSGAGAISFASGLIVTLSFVLYTLML